MAEGPSVTVIVPAYNAEATLPACLAAINAMTYPVDELIVFSDGSTDSTPEIAEAAGARVIRNTGRSLGPGKGRNVASKEAKSDLLLFVDADVVIEPDCLEKLIEDMLENGATAAFASYDDEPASTRLAGKYANLRHHFVHQFSERDATTFWSGVGLIDRQVFVDLGGYDDIQFAHPSIEDVELGMRLKAGGHRIRLVPHAQAKHCKDWTLWRVWHTDIVRRAMPWSRLIIGGKSDGADLNLRRKERGKALVSMATFGSLLVALYQPAALLLTAALFYYYMRLNKGFFRVLKRQLTTSQYIRAMLMHLFYHSYSLVAFGWVAAEKAILTAFSSDRADKRDYAVRFDVPFFACLALLTLMFSWALIYQGKPAYFDDTAAYFSGGRKIISRLFSVFGMESLVTGAGGGLVGTTGANGPGAVRSIPYYVLTYLLSAPRGTLVVLAVFQSAVAAFYVVTHARTEHLRAYQIILIGLVLAVASPVAFVTAFTVPDFFAAPIIGSIVLLALRFDRIAPLFRAFLVVLTGMGIATHVSYPPLALGVTGLAVLWLLWSQRSTPHNALPGALLGGLPLFLGVVAMVIGGLAGFGEASVAPKRIPLVLARSMSDGPGRWYLEEHCATEHYAICEVFPDGKFPEGLGPLLFQDGGMMKVATDEQLDRIRAEEPEIVMKAVRAYPWFQVQKTVSSIGRQFVTYHPIDVNFDRLLYYDSERTLRVTKPELDHSQPVRTVDMLAHLFLPISALLLLISLPLMRRGNLPVVVLCLLGVAANMVICATFSAVAARYGMRVLWMVPLLTMIYALAPLGRFLPRPSRGAGAPGVDVRRHAVPD